MAYRACYACEILFEVRADAGALTCPRCTGSLSDYEPEPEARIETDPINAAAPEAVNPAIVATRPFDGLGAAVRRQLAQMSHGPLADGDGPTSPDALASVVIGDAASAPTEVLGPSVAAAVRASSAPPQDDTLRIKNIGELLKPGPSPVPGTSPERMGEMVAQGTAGPDQETAEHAPAAARVPEGRGAERGVEAPKPPAEIVSLGAEASRSGNLLVGGAARTNPIEPEPPIATGDLPVAPTDELARAEGRAGASLRPRRQTGETETLPPAPIAPKKRHAPASAPRPVRSDPVASVPSTRAGASQSPAQWLPILGAAVLLVVALVGALRVLTTAPGASAPAEAPPAVDDGARPTDPPAAASAEGGGTAPTTPPEAAQEDPGVPVSDVVQAAGAALPLVEQAEAVDVGAMLLVTGPAGTRTAAGPVDPGAIERDAVGAWRTGVRAALEAGGPGKRALTLAVDRGRRVSVLRTNAYAGYKAGFRRFALLVQRGSEGEGGLPFVLRLPDAPLPAAGSLSVQLGGLGIRLVAVNGAGAQISDVPPAIPRADDGLIDVARFAERLDALRMAHPELKSAALQASPEVAIAEIAPVLGRLQAAGVSTALDLGNLPE